MSKDLLNDLPELLKAGIIDDGTSAKIKEYYLSKSKPDGNRLVIIFGILGALLVGLGIILIIAHNWDEFPKSVRLAVACTPLLLSQIMAFILLFRKSESVLFRETVGVFLVLSVALSIAITSQVYNISGDFGRFLFVWAVLSLPVVYLMRSSMASMLVWITACWFSTEAESYGGSAMSVNYYLLLIGLVIPHYIFLIRQKRLSNFTIFHHWIISISFAISVAMIMPHHGWILPTCFCFFAIYILISQSTWFSDLSLIRNPFAIIGNAGTIVLLLFITFKEPNLYESKGSEWFFNGLLAVTILLFAYILKTKRFFSFQPISFVFIFIPPIFLIGMQNSTSPRLFSNILILALSLTIMREGSKKNHLGIINYGLLILSSLIICRFFDTDLSFVLRGILFIAVGVGFFVVNYSMLRKKHRN